MAGSLKGKLFYDRFSGSIGKTEEGNSLGLYSSSSTVIDYLNDLGQVTNISVVNLLFSPSYKIGKKTNVMKENPLIELIPMGVSTRDTNRVAAYNTAQ